MRRDRGSLKRQHAHPKWCINKAVGLSYTICVGISMRHQPLKDPTAATMLTTRIASSCIDPLFATAQHGARQQASLPLHCPLKKTLPQPPTHLLVLNGVALKHKRRGLGLNEQPVEDVGARSHGQGDGRLRGEGGAAHDQRSQQHTGRAGGQGEVPGGNKWQGVVSWCTMWEGWRTR